MWYAIISSDIENSAPLREKARSRHLEYVRRLRDLGRLLLAGPHPAVDSRDCGPAGMSGSLIVAEFPNITEARSWAEQDPYRQAGVFESVTVKPFVAVYS